MYFLHGMSGSPTWLSWKGMLARCYNKNAHSFDRYGGRGIRVCRAWKSFSGFLRDMGIRPEGSSLDRINNDGNYSPRNCRWASRSEQGRNRRSNKMIRIFGETKTLIEWSQDHRCLVTYATAAKRLQYGWPPREAISTRPHCRKTA